MRAIRLTTTNDNTRALRFYQRAGFRLTSLHVGAVTEARKRKPQTRSAARTTFPSATKSN